MEVKLTLWEARNLFNLAGNYGIVTQAHGGKQDPYWAARAWKEQQIVKLWSKLKSLATQLPGNSWRIGPENPEKENGTLEYELNLHDDDRDAAFYVLSAALDPRSPLKQPISVQEDIIWPIADKIRKRNALRRELKLHETKPEKIEDDPAEGKKEEAPA